MRIAYLTDSFWPMVNGVAVSLTLGVPRLRQLGFDIEIFAPRYHGYADPEEYIHRWPSVRYMKNPPFFLAMPVGELMRYLQSQPWDIIHFHTPLILGWIARGFAARRNLPLVYTYHTMIESALHYMPLPNNADRLTWLASAYNRYWCDSCNAVIAPSVKVERMLLAQGIKAEVRQINYGIDIERFNGGVPVSRDAARAAWGLPPNKLLLLYVGRLGGEKNVGFLLRAHARLMKENMPQELHFVLAGDGNERQALENLTAELGLTQHTTFLGNVSRDRLPELYRLADLFISASTTEAQGVVMIEAIAAGLPVVAAKDEAFDGILLDGRNCNVVNLNMDDFVAACRAVLSDPERRAVMGRASQEISHEFAIERHVESVGRLYTDLGSGPPRQRPQREMIAALVALASLVCLAYFFNLSLFMRRLGRNAPPPPSLPAGVEWPFVTVITAFRGIDPVLRDNLNAFFSQDYPRYQYLLAVPSTADPAYPELRALAEAYPDRARVCVAEAFSSERADKLNNILAALPFIHPQSEVLVFYNADGQVRPDFLKALAAPLADGTAQVSTSCRWLEPQGSTLVEVMNTLWGNIVMSLQVHPRHTLPWGGAMALRRELFERLSVAELWSGALCDDNALGWLLKSNKVSTAFVARAFAVEPSFENWRSFMAFGMRQLFFLRVTLPGDWVAGALAMTFLGPAPLILALWLGWTALAGRWATGHTILAGVTAVLLVGVVATVWNLERGVEDLLRGLGFKIVGVPWPALLLSSAATVLMWLQVIASGIGRRIKWGPIVYEAIAPFKTRVVKVDA